MLEACKNAGLRPSQTVIIDRPNRNIKFSFLALHNRPRARRRVLPLFLRKNKKEYICLPFRIGDGKRKTEKAEC